MSSHTDKRTVATDALETLGTIIDETAGRDAIHLAVEPVVAAQLLAPGADVGFVPGGVGVCDNPVGIVDPFLTRKVQPGERFWLVVYPRQITSLRHVWTHPAFGDAVEPAAKPDDEVTASRKWIEDFAARIPLAYDVLMEGARAYIMSGDYLCFGGLLEGEYVPDEFWPHYERVTGTKVAEDKRDSFFSCSC